MIESSLIFKNLHDTTTKAVSLGLERVSRGKRNWSTDLRTPVMERSFLSSTVTVWSVKVLNTEKMS